METLRLATLEIAPGFDPAMLIVFAASLGIIFLAMLGMALGLILSGRPLMGSCGGVACRRACGGKSETCSRGEPLVKLPDRREAR